MIASDAKWLKKKYHFISIKSIDDSSLQTKEKTVRHGSERVRKETGDIAYLVAREERECTYFVNKDISSHNDVFL